MVKAGQELFDLLKKDHREAQDGLRDTLDGTIAGEKSIKKVLNIIMLHMEMEEKFLYPRLKDIEETQDLIKDAFQEHNKAKEVIREIIRNDLSDTDTIEDQVENLLDLINHHIREEETQLFPKMEKVCQPHHFQKLYAEMKEMKENNINKAFV